MLVILVIWFFAFQCTLGDLNTNLEEKIGTLEKKLELLSDVVFRLSSEKDELKARMKALEESGTNANRLENCKCETLQNNVEKQSVLSSSNATNGKEEKKKGFNQHEDISINSKRIVPPTSTPTGVIAFHAYLSHDSSGPLPMHHILKFDMVPLNKGNGYKAFDGIFIASMSGTYVFSWSFMSDVHGNVLTELTKNADVIGNRFADSLNSAVYDFSTGTVVVDILQGDHVYVRMGESTGQVNSISVSRTTFSGWLLH
nr:complement C1q-like protein 4 [Crassostrea gigas]